MLVALSTVLMTTVFPQNPTALEILPHVSTTSSQCHPQNVATWYIIAKGVGSNLKLCMHVHVDLYRYTNCHRIKLGLEIKSYCSEISLSSLHY